MSKQTHTPGPWVVDLDREFFQDGDQVSVEAMTVDGMVAREVCSLFLDTGEDKDGEDYAEDAANARLIAAAPDLLTALRDLCDAIPDATVEADPPLGCWVEMAREAISKAEGREP